MSVDSATEDILNNGRFEGALKSISFITEFVDYFFVMFISFVSFFIISAALLRNVIAAAYASFPKFFDKVDDIHKELENRAIGDGNGDKNKNSGIIKAALAFIPNFKELSDFEADTVSPKDYFIRAIPQMFIVVLIGAIIYNGQYRDVVVKVSNLGTTMIARFITNVDPIAVFDKIMKTTTDPKFAVDGGKDKLSKNQLIVCKKVYNQIVGYYTDITSKEAKTNVATQVETTVNGWLTDSQIGQYANSKNWNMSISADRVFTKPDQTAVERNNSSTNNQKRFCRSVAVPTEINFESGMHQDEIVYIRVIFNFSRDFSNSNREIALDDLVMHVDSIVSKNGGFVIKFKTGHALSANTFQIQGKTGASLTSDTNGYILTLPAGMGTLSSDKNTITSPGLKYNTGNGVTHTIKAIQKDSKKGTITSVAYKNYGGTDVAIGEDISTKAAAKAAEEQKINGSKTEEKSSSGSNAPGN